MVGKKLFSCLSLLLLVFPLKLAFGLPAKQVDSGVRSPNSINKNLHNKSYSVPDPPTGSEGRPNGGNTGGGTRGGCPQDANNSPDLTLLIPENREGLTVTEYPTFFAFVPQTKARKGEFILYDRTEKKLVYRTIFDLTGIPGIVSVQLPKNKSYLKIGNNYEWRFSLHCKLNDDRSEDVMKIGLIKRVALNDAIGRIQTNTNQLDKARAYKENNIWYDALQTLAELRPTASNTSVNTMWQQLLSSQQNLNEIVSYPLVDCCKPTN